MDETLSAWWKPGARLTDTVTLFFAYTFAQFVDKGDYVKVKKGNTLCSNIKMEQAKGALDPGRIFWRVTSPMRANGTQTVAAFVLENHVRPQEPGDLNVPVCSFPASPRRK
jgi:hypothetical protein